MDQWDECFAGAGVHPRRRRQAGQHIGEVEKVSRYDRVERTSPWIIVAVFLAGSLVIAAAIVMGSLLLGIVGSVLVVAAVLGWVVLPHLGLSAPLSFSVNFPEGAGRPSDSDDQEEPYRKIPETPARRLPEGPDRERAKPQWVNLGPHEHLRSIGGEEVIEVPEEERRRRK